MSIGVLALVFGGLCGLMYLVMAPYQTEPVKRDVDYAKVYAKVAVWEL